VATTSQGVAGTVPAGWARSAHRRVLITWVAVYPALMAAQLLIGPYLVGVPLAVRLLVISGVVVPAVVYVLVPALNQLAGVLSRTRVR